MANKRQRKILKDLFPRLLGNACFRLLKLTNDAAATERERQQ